MKKIIKILSILIVICLITSFTSCKKKDNKDKEIDILDLSVRDYECSNGIVTAANPYAAKAGLDILKNGGNAFDAAVAVAFALGVVEPNASGIGGGGIMVGYDATSGEFVSYNFREFAPGAATASQFSGDIELDDNIKASGVPTEVAGLLKILDDLGTKTRQDVLAPAISYAKNGVTVTPELAKAISDDFFKIYRSSDEVLSVFTKDGEGFDPIPAGDKLVQSDYAHALELISEKGLEGFYKGEIADAIIALQTKYKGLITYEDLEYAMTNYPIIETPLQGSYNGYDIITATTPSSGGIILLEALNMLEVYGKKNGSLASLGHNSAEYINAVATALQLSYGDKRKYIADSKIESVPITGLISKEYAAARWTECFNESHSYMGRFTNGGNDTSLDYGNPWPYVKNKAEVSYVSEDYDEHQSTTSFSIIDKDGNIVTITQTINYFFGNGLVPENCGFFMNNQMSSFSLTASSVHYVKPYKQPVSHIMPTIIMKDGDPFATLGSPGGMRIPSAVLQVVLNLIDFNYDMQTAINKPRVYCYAVASDDQSNTSRDLYVEKSISASVLDKLTEMNYNVIKTGSGDIDLYFGGVQGITYKFTTDGILLHGGADPRRDGKALGY